MPVSGRAHELAVGFIFLGRTDGDLRSTPVHGVTPVRSSAMIVPVSGRAQDLAAGFIFLGRTDGDLRSTPVHGEDAGTIKLATTPRTRRGRRHDQVSGKPRTRRRRRYDLNVIASNGSTTCLSHLFRKILKQFLTRHQNRLWFTDAFTKTTSHHA